MDTSTAMVSDLFDANAEPRRKQDQVSPAAVTKPELALVGVSGSSVACAGATYLAAAADLGRFFSIAAAITFTSSVTV
jgi:hypothetical protein